MRHRLAVMRAGARVLVLMPVMVFLMVLSSVCSGSSLVYAQASGPISVRTLQKAQDESPFMTAALAEKKDSAVRYTEGQNLASQDKDTAAAKPDVKAAPRETSDEYGDVTPEELGITSKERGPSDEYGDVASEDAAGEEVYDPIRPFNTAMYHFNDKVYFWAWKPVSTGYKHAVPEELRSAIANFYENLKAPIRIVNNVLQGDLPHAGSEFLSLLINSTIGVGGLRNCAQDCFGIQRDYADFGQTLGKWGFGYGFYLVLPFLGPSDCRDGIGLLFDWPLRPTSYLGEEFFNEYNVGLYIHEKVNFTSFHIGEYEALKDASVDPYVAMRDVYLQYRSNIIRKP